MKKSVLLSLVAAAALIFTGCQDEKPYSVYQIGVNFPAIDQTVSENNMTPEQLSEFRVANFIAGWLINQQFVYSGNLGKPITFEGDNEAYNDEQALAFYDNKYNELAKVYEEGKITAALEEAIEKGTLKDVTTAVSVRFTYAMYKGSSGSLMLDENGVAVLHSFTVNYDPDMVADE